jgi:hypothetical protein
MARFDAPPEIRALADARARARRARDWATADSLKAEIESAGWKVVDAGTMYDLVLAVPPDVVEDGVTRYGASSSVPSRLGEAEVGLASVVIVVEDEAAPEVGRLLREVEAHAPDGVQVVVVANGVGEALGEALDAVDSVDPGAPGVVTEVVHLAARTGRAAALNAGTRRAMAPVVIWLDSSVAIDGDPVSPLVRALEDEGVAVAGPVGLVADDPSSFETAPPDATDVAAIDGRLLAFRRVDYAERGPLDEGFAHPSSLDAWWSLVLRDGWFSMDADGAAGGLPTGEEDLGTADSETGFDPETVRPRRAVQLATLPVTLPAGPVPAAPDGADERARKRNRYRLLKRFASRRDLLA